MEKLSKSLQDGRKLSAGESYQDLMPGMDNEDHVVKHRNVDKHSSFPRQRPRSLNFEVFFEEGDNKTDDEKLESSSGELEKGWAQSANNELESKVSLTDHNELN